MAKERMVIASSSLASSRARLDAQYPARKRVSISVNFLAPAGRGTSRTGCVDNNGTIHWSHLCLKPGGFKIVSTQAAVRAEGYQATAIVRPGLVAGVSRSHID